MSEDEAERWAERRMNALDRRYLRSDMTEREYIEEVARIDRQVSDMIREGA